MKANILISSVLASLILGCAATNLNGNATNVLVSNDHKAPNGCKYLGQVVGNQGNMVTGEWTSNQNMAIGAMNDLRNKAAEKGGNYVQLLTNQAGNTGSGSMSDGIGGGGYEQTNVTNIGNVYDCPESAINVK